MKNIITKISAIALLSATTFASQAELITAGSAQTNIGNANPTVTDTSAPGEVLFNLDSFQYSEVGDSAGAFVSSRENAEFALAANANGEADARAEITQTYMLVNGLNSTNYLFNYFIDAGALSANCASIFGLPLDGEQSEVTEFEFPSTTAFDCGAGMSSNYATAAYEASVTLFRGADRTEFFNSSVRIASDGNGISLQEDITEVQAGTAIAGEQVFSFTPSEGVYLINGGQFQIDLGEILAGESISVEYKVSISASTYLAGMGSMDSNYLPSAFAGFGDPTGLQGFMSSSLVAAPVSAPGNLLLLGFSLLALAFARRKTAKK